MTKTSDNEFSLDWETKGPAILGMLGGLENYVAARLSKEEKLDKFMSTIKPKSVVGTLNFMYPFTVTLN